MIKKIIDANLFDNDEEKITFLKCLGLEVLKNYLTYFSIQYSAKITSKSKLISIMLVRVVPNNKQTSQKSRQQTPTQQILKQQNISVQQPLPISDNTLKLLTDNLKSILENQDVTNTKLQNFQNIIKKQQEKIAQLQDTIFDKDQSITQII